MPDSSPAPLIVAQSPPAGLVPGGMQPPPEDDEAGIPWARYIAALRRYKFLIVGIVMAGTGLGVFASRFVRPEYEVQATILIEREGGNSGPVQPDQLLQSTAWIELLRSFAVLDTVVQRERLYVSMSPADAPLFAGFRVDSAFQPGSYQLDIDRSQGRLTLHAADGLTVDQAAAGDSVGRALGFLWAPDAAAVKSETVKFTVLSPREAAVKLSQNMLTRMNAERGNFIGVALRGDNPKRLASTLNTMLDHFVVVAADLKSYRLREQSRILREQMDAIGDQLRDAENRLESFKTRIITLPSEATPIAPGLQSTQPTAITRYFGQKVQAEELRTDREALERLLREVQGGTINAAAFQSIPSVQQSPPLREALANLIGAEAEVSSLRQRYTDEAKPVQLARERLNTLRTVTIPAETRALLASIRQQEGELDARLSAASRELQAIPQRVITEQRLEREVASLSSIYTDVQARYQSARLAEASAIPDVRVLDRAVPPQRPSSNNAPRIILMAVAASIGLAVAVAILLDQLDRRFRYPDQVTRELGLAILGAVPRIRHPKQGTPSAEESAQVIEAFRAIRLNVVHSYGAAGPVLLTVTSPQPGDGKSVVSSNLALSFSEAGYRTVLIDGDTRRGELHRMFGQERVPGLLDLLARETSLEQVLRTTSHPNLTLVPCGTRMQRGPELLGSGDLRELLAVLKSRFDVVIFDSPPLGAGVDPFVLASATGNLLLVLRSGETDRQLAESKLELVDRLPIRLLGAVLNDIKAGEGHYRYYGYSYGYTADEEPRQLAAGSLVRE